MPSTRQPFSRRRMTSGAKSESDDTITTTAGGCAATSSMASTASAMSVAFLPVERLTMGRIEWRLKNCWCLHAVSAVQWARRTWIAPCSASTRVMAWSMTLVDTLSASMNSITVAGVLMPISSTVFRRLAAA